MSEAKDDEAPPTYRPKTFAVVSGKGGSGKTLIATSIAAAHADAGINTLLIDADFGTGGLTYYLGFNTFTGARTGLAELLIHNEQSITISRPTIDAIQSQFWLRRIGLLPVGSHRLLERESVKIEAADLERIIDLAAAEFEIVIFDCRGGIDEHSIMVCQSADEIIVIAETDAASIQATQYLVSKLSDIGLRKKIAGFILNKVMDDPSSLANAARSLFNTEYLGAIPFDISTTREFIKGNIPKIDSIFSRHVLKASSRLSDRLSIFSDINTLSPKEFGSITLRDPAIRTGGIIIGAASLYVTFAAIAIIDRILELNIEYFYLYIYSVICIYVALIASALSDQIKKYVGRHMTRYVKYFSVIFSRR